jgi:hypothetical protein
MEQTSYRIGIDRDWSLEDFYKFGRTFEQVYFFAYSIGAPKSESEQERIERAFSSFPWRGGYSSVNFFNSLKFAVPKRERPRIVSLHYASPGWIELSLWIGAAVAVQRLVRAVSSSVLQANSGYHEIITNLQERKLLRIKVKEQELSLSRDELAYITECAETMSKLLGFKTIDEVHQLTGNPYKSLKILLAVYRRVKTLADFQNNGKADLPD